MPGDNSVSELKVNLWMPLDIGPFLQDTAHLNTEEIGAYTLLLIYYWAHGPLPNDPRRLANIAKMTVDTWSITQEALSMYFSVGSDGLLHQKGADRRRAQWLDKRLKAREKAIKAITARWSKYRAKLASMRNTPSIPREVREEVLENYPTSEVQVQKQQLPPPTPSAARRGIETAAEDSAELPENHPNSTGRTGGLAAIGTELPAARPARGAPTAKSEDIGKQARNAARGASGGGNGATRRRSSTARTAVGATAGNGHKKMVVRPSKPDPRESLFEREILVYWKGQVPKHPNLKFQPADHRALTALLKGHPEMDISLFRELLKNRAQSDVAPAALPHKWLRNLMEYAAGPLGKYGKAAERSRSL